MIGAVLGVANGVLRYLDDQGAFAPAPVEPSEDEQLALAREIMNDPANHSAIEIMKAREEVAAITEKQRQRAAAAKAAEEREKARVEAEFARRSDEERRAAREAEATARAEAKAERQAARSLLRQAEEILADPMSSDDELVFARGIMGRFGPPS